MLRRPGIALLVVVILALGISASTTMFSVVEAVILRPLPYADPGRLVFLWTVDNKRGTPEDLASYPAFLDWKQQSRLFDDMAALFLPALVGVTLTGSDDPMYIQGAKVSPNLFALLGVHPIEGRAFTEQEAEERDGVVVISDWLWEQRFGRDEEIVGERLEVEGAPKRIIGVMPPSFRFPSRATHLWEPHTAFPQWLEKRATRFSNLWAVVGRLKPGVSVRQAQAEMSAIAARLEQQYPASHDGLGVNIVPLDVQLTGENLRRALWILFAAAACVLLIACTNVANLLAAHGEGRAREIAVRIALGAGRWRLVRQLVTESCVLAAAAGALGVFFAFAGLRLLTALVPADFPRLDEAGLTGEVLALAVIVSAVTVILFGFSPALKVSGKTPKLGLQDAARGSSMSFGRRRTQNILAVGQIALAVILLSGAGLLIRSFERLQQVDPGFLAEGLLSLRVSPPKSMTRLQRMAFYRELLQAVKGIPGVNSAGVINELFSQSAPSGLVTAEGMPPAPRGQAIKNSQVSPGFFRTLGIPLRSGRFFTDLDNPGDSTAAVINETMARRFWPGDNAIGKRFKWGGPDSPRPWITVIGVTADTRRQGLERGPVAELFLANSYRSTAGMDLVVRSALDLSRLSSAVQEVVRSVDRRVPVYSFSTVRERLDGLSARRRMQTWLLSLFAAVALALAAIGVYGLQYHAATQRRLEFGIRMALGTSAAEVLRLVFAEGMKLSLTGLILGLAGAFSLTRLIGSQLFGVTATDWVTYAIVSLVLVSAASLASYLPIRRVLTIDPMMTLRHE